MKSKFCGFRGSSYVSIFCWFKSCRLYFVCYVFKWFRCVGGVIKQDFNNCIVALIMFREIRILKVQMVFARISYALNLMMLRFSTLLFLLLFVLMCSMRWRGNTKWFLWFYICFNIVSLNVSFEVSEGFRMYQIWRFTGCRCCKFFIMFV